MTKHMLSGASLLCWLMFGLLTSVAATPVPQQVSQSLNEREMRLSNLAFDWQMTYHQRNSAETPQEIQARQQAVREQLPRDFKRAGMTDGTIKQIVEGAVEDAAKDGMVKSYHSTTPWRFERNGDQALVSGVRQSIKDGTQEYFSNDFHQFYDKNWGLVINDRNEVNGKPLQPRLVSAWAAPGDALRYSGGIADGLGIKPEHFAMLLGLNPLAMYGLTWKLVAETPQAWSLEAPFMQNGYLLFTVKLVLDRSHGDAPSQIQVNRGGQTLTFRAESYRQYKGEWLCDKVEFHNQMPDVEMRAGTDIKETWVLQDVAPSQPIQVSVPKGMAVKDFRLLGSQINGVFESGLTPQQQQAIVSYRWNGHFSSLDELKN